MSSNLLETGKFVSSPSKHSWTPALLLPTCNNRGKERNGPISIFQQKELILQSIIVVVLLLLLLLL